MSWQRVSKKSPCSGCGKCDWCLISADGKTCICMRVESPRSFRFGDGAIGWFHTDQNPTPPSVKSRPDPVINVGRLVKEWTDGTTTSQYVMLGTKLGVSVKSLRELQCCWAPEHRAWAFPMCDGYGEFCGIRLRSDGGAKWAVPGSHQGLFWPRAEPDTCCLLSEGPTDAAAGLSLGFFTIGRPSCSGGVNHVKAALKRLGVKRAIIFSDNDGPGLRGAETLSAQLPMPTATLVLPTKDIRDFVRAGGNRQCVESIVKGLVWRQPNE